ncbi:MULTISPECIES: HlyD family efflux transporter periplasmic adaptor subunit [Moorena]|uniref:Multidrug resistance efflux pump n=1 Tax=Moorena producens 3L TaxID=489825 RepID=F4XKH0_9CYAN|nr:MULTISPECIES: HlyD family efflux transporter periplasmic adaptor subunit [Moorena]NEQ13369.1 HlyD family efflux transporter periplasmic adaptor subunit [Moorena sp. SIO3E2]EGJ34825.1 multidrug resistance efflux pump [Moorena producens 3L]NEP32161.1 HlyD family efflux transporter periplasmic adaptor subunit [Moorena sp. SIO3B2]NEP67273.1 HlyD family efflux transporter periplasmic adaptor subunit [Moorena sp. SIO3A5]NEQ07710.1 HlyD family efflux transporter periplasmic adaptor subunit [Mooren
MNKPQPSIPSREGLPEGQTPHPNLTSAEIRSIYGGTAVSAPPLPQSANHVQNPVTPTSSLGATNTENWSTALQNLLDQPPSVLPQRLLLGGFAFCMVCGVWATFGQIDEVGKATGKLVPKGEVYKIHPIQSGKVAKIAVKEGESVTAGQVLVELDKELGATEVERLEQLINADQIKLIQMQGLIENIHQEAQTRQQIAKADIDAQQAAIAQAQTKVAALREQLIQHQQANVASQDRLERLKRLKATTQALLQQRQDDAFALKERLENLKPLLASGAISKEQVFQAEHSLRASQRVITQTQLQEAASNQDQIYQAQQSIRDRNSAITLTHSDLNQTLAEIQRLQAGLTQKQAEVHRTQLETKQKLQQLEIELTQLNAKIAENRNLLTSAKARLKQKFLYAPVDGVVSSLNVANIGEVFQPGQTIAEVAPQDAPLVLSASLPNQEAGFIKEGMPVQIKLDAYPYQEYGIIKGKVTSLSADAKTDQQLGSVYEVEVSLNRDYVTEDDQMIRFKPGQTAKADIIIRRRRIVDFLLDPIRQLQKGGVNL